MKRTLANLFSIQPGEGSKTFLLFALHLVFYVGLRWGDSAGYSLFIENWGADNLPLTQAGIAVLAVIIGMTYSIFAGRISNQRMLLTLGVLIIAWLASVRVLFLLPAASGPSGVVYPYYYIAGRAFSDLAALHVLNYISDFYDTRAAKRVLPLMLSATIFGGIVANFSAEPLERGIGLDATPLAWSATLVVVIGLALLIRWRLPGELAQIDQAQPDRPFDRLRAGSAASSARSSLLANLRLVLKSGILFWLAVSTLLLVVLMGLLNMQSGKLLDMLFAGDSKEIFRFTNFFDGIFNIAGVIFSSLLFSRLLSRIGVGAMNLVFPLITLLAVGAVYLPGLAGPLALGAAVLGRADDRTFKKVFRNSIDPMLFNSVPQHVKARARGFINSSMVPLGTLAAALIQPAIAGGSAATLQLGLWAGLGIGLLYVVSALRVRVEYRRALVKMVAEDEFAIFRSSHADFEQPDPNMLRQLEQRLLAGQDDDDITAFLAEMLYDFRGRQAFDVLQELAARRGPAVRAGIIQMLGEDWIGDPVVRQMCLDGLRHADALVRRAAAAALARAPNVAQDEEVLDAFVDVSGKRDEATQASIIPPLIASGDFYYLMPAVHILYEWLSDKRNSRRRALGLRVLSQTGDARLIRRLARFLTDPAPDVRAQAAELVAHLSAQAPLEDMKRLGLDALRTLLDDADETVRLAAVDGLGQLSGPEATQALLIATRDPSFEVRRRACAAMSHQQTGTTSQTLPTQDLERALEGRDVYAAVSAAFLLARGRHRRAKRRTRDLCHSLMTEVYTLQVDSLPLHQLNTPGAHLLKTTFQEQAARLLEQVFWLAGALSTEAAAESIRRSLSSESSQVRANALESLEAITTPQLARLIGPFFDSVELPALARIGRDEMGLPGPSVWEVCLRTWPQLSHSLRSGTSQGAAAAPPGLRRAPFESDDWLAAMSMVTLVELIDSGQLDRAAGADGEEAPSASLRTGPSADRVREALRAAGQTDSALLQETARLALSQLDTHHRRDALPTKVGVPDTTHGREARKGSMLTVIEKVIFLKEVPFFQGMSVGDLRLLAGISEEKTYDTGQQIIAEGERGDALYVIVSGRVGIQHRRQDAAEATLTQLAALGPREYFAEMSIFDEEPHSADAVAMTPTQVLLMRRAPLVALVTRQPELALSLFRVLSQRLRHANELLAKKKHK